MGVFKERTMACVGMAFLGASALAFFLPLIGKLALLGGVLLFCSLLILLRRQEIVSFVLLFIAVLAALHRNLPQAVFSGTDPGLSGGAVVFFD
jgi:hypothetical protein